MSKQNEITKNHAKKVIFMDKVVSPALISQTLKIEIFSVLSQFMELKMENLKTTLTMMTDGSCSVTITAKTNQLKQIGYVI